MDGYSHMGRLALLKMSLPGLNFTYYCHYPGISRILFRQTSLGVPVSLPRTAAEVQMASASAWSVVARAPASGPKTLRLAGAERGRPTASRGLDAIGDLHTASVIAGQPSRA